MECVLRGLTYDACLVYLDDVIVIGGRFQEQLGNLRSVPKTTRAPTEIEPCEVPAVP